MARGAELCPKSQCERVMPRFEMTDVAVPSPLGCEPAWYAAYTCANHERRVAKQFGNRGLEYFLPQYEAVHKWQDRRVRLQLPLFPGYVFVRMALCDRLRALQVTSVVRLVGFGDEPTALDSKEIETLRNGLQHCGHAQPHPYLAIGKRVRIGYGPLTGLEGTLLRRKSRWRLLVSIELIGRAIVVDVDSGDVLPLRDTPKMAHQRANELMSSGLRSVAFPDISNAR